MRFYLKNLCFVFISLIGHLLFRSWIAPSTFRVDINSLDGFFNYFGAVWGVLAGFIILVVWSRYNKIKETADTEANSLLELYSLVRYLEDKRVSESIKNIILEYVDAVVKDGWDKLGRGEKSEKASNAIKKLSDEIRYIKSERKRFPVIFGQVVEKLENVSDLRSQRVSLSTEHLPMSLKILFLFESFALIFSVYMLPAYNLWLSLFLTIVTSGTVSLTLSVINDLDNPLIPGDWNLTPEPFERLAKELEEN